jgi:hypothetical protein
MKKIIAIAILMVIGLLGLNAQPVAEFRVENESLTSSTTYEFDVYVYNTGASSFEMRAGTIALLVNPAWKNGGNLATTAPIRIASTSELSAANHIDVMTELIPTLTSVHFSKVLFEGL